MFVCCSKDILVEPGSLGSGRTITPESIVSPLHAVKVNVFYSRKCVQKDGDLERLSGGIQLESWRNHNYLLD